VCLGFRNKALIGIIQEAPIWNCSAATIQKWNKAYDIYERSWNHNRFSNAYFEV